MKRLWKTQEEYIYRMILYNYRFVENCVQVALGSLEYYELNKWFSKYLFIIMWTMHIFANPVTIRNACILTSSHNNYFTSYIWHHTTQCDKVLWTIQRRFSSSVGLVLTCLGSTVSAGNIWRYPRVVAMHAAGGGM